MLLKQKFKTLAGAQKRCATENALSKTHYYVVEWFSNGERITETKASHYTKNTKMHWQLSKHRKSK